MTENNHSMQPSGCPVDSKTQLTRYSQLAIGLILCIVFISAGSIFWNTYTVASKEAERIRLTAAEYADTLAHTLEKPLWDVDRLNIRTLCRFYLENELVNRVRLVGVSGEVFIDEAQTFGARPVDTITQTRVIRHQGEILGTLTIVVVATKADLLNKQMRYSIVITAFILLLTMIVLWLMRGRTRAAMELAELNAHLVYEIKQRKKAEEEQGRLIKELQDALNEVKQLSGLLPICSNCKKIRNDEGYWSQVDEYISEHTEARFSHGICPECIIKLYPDCAEELLKGLKDKSDN